MKQLFLIFLIQLSLYATDATIDIVKKVRENIKIAVETFPSGEGDKAFSRQIEKMIIADLKVAAVFLVSDSKLSPRYDSPIPMLQYRDKSVQLLLRIQSFASGGKYGILADLFDLENNRKLLAKKYSVSSEARYPFLTHKLTADIAKKLEIEDLGWMEKFVIFAKNTSPKESEIVIGDYSLTFTQTIISGGLVLFPKWRDGNQREFFYTEIGDKPTLYRANLYTGKKEKVISSYGMLVCSDVSSDGEKLLLTMAPDDQPDIYTYDLESKKLERVTEYKGIDVNGNFVNDDDEIVFVSDRLGGPNIFSKKISSNAVQQMVFRGRNNNFCTSFNNYIAYVSRDTNNEFSENAFNIYLISTQTDYIRQLTTTGKNLFPRFSPSGDSMLYIKRFQNESALGIIRLGYNKSFLFPLKTGKLQAIDW